MPRVRLRLEHSRTAQVFRFLRPDGTRAAIPALRLTVVARLMPLVRPGINAVSAAFPECIVDTGSHLTTIPERIWGQFKPSAVTPLPFDPAVPQSQRVVSLLGGTFHYDLAELSFQLRDLVGGVMTVTVVAQLLRDGGRLNSPLILGLRGGVLDGRILRAEPDATAPHGRAWVLVDP